ncbi:MAG TPA: hypothetical protein VK171_01860, partial [Fimbriimonas sp.]|nr:hypothetical protein [Fimbriimonas sp.]
MLTTKIHTEFTPIQSEWEELSLSSPYATPFQSLNWASNWLKHYPRRTKIITIHQGNDMVALFPLVESIAPWRSLRPLGVGPSDYLGPLLRSDNLDVINTLHDCLQTFSNTSLIDLHQLPNDHPFAQCVVEPIEQAKCLIVDLPPTNDAYVAGLSKSLRYDVRRLRGKALT